MVSVRVRVGSWLVLGIGSGLDGALEPGEG